MMQLQIKMNNVTTGVADMCKHIILNVFEGWLTNSSISTIFENNYLNYNKLYYKHCVFFLIKSLILPSTYIACN